jgi:hypothetical protein
MVAASRDPKDPQAWSPTNIDSWFLADAGQIDASGAPTEIFTPASISSRILEAGPSFVVAQTISGTTPNTFDLADTKLRVRIDDSPPPDVPAPPPASLAPGLAVFQSFTGAGTDQGMCGALTVGSFVNVVLPQEFSLGPNACQPASVCSDSRTYTYCGPGQPVGPNCNSMLDVLVGGCKVTALCVPAVKPTQPDVGSGGNPPAPLAFAADGKVHPSVPTDGYSFYIRVNGRRAHLTNNLQ